MYGCESWTIKKSECQRIDVCKLCWSRLLRVPWTARRSNESIPKEINPKYSLEQLMVKLKIQSFGHLMGRADSLEKTLILLQRRSQFWLHVGPVSLTCFCCFIIIQNGLPQRILPLCLTVKLKCLCSEPCPLVDGRKEEINTSSTWGLPF